MDGLVDATTHEVSHDQIMTLRFRLLARFQSWFILSCFLLLSITVLPRLFFDPRACRCWDGRSGEGEIKNREGLSVSPAGTTQWYLWDWWRNIRGWR